jgi:serine/threonine-protein kinase
LTYVIGQVINGRYEVLDFLGGGGYGQVYKVQDHTTGQISALKTTSTWTGGPWDEAQILTGLQGEYVLAIRNADLAAGVPFIVTEVAEHGTAQNAIASGIGIPVAQAVRWAQHASRGIARVHDLGLVHNDIKPDNLFISADGDPLVGDMGVSCLRDASGHGAFAGTAATMAPEVAVVPGTVPQALWPTVRPTSIASDIYSLGATLYWLLAGKPPYSHPSSDMFAVAAAVVASPPQPLRDAAPNVPQGVAEVVATAMARNPLDRYPTAAAFDAALGSRSKQVRQWTPLTAHAGHSACFIGTGHGSDLHVCAVPTGRGTQHEVQVHHVGSGRRVLPWKATPASALPQALRSAFRNHA